MKNLHDVAMTGAALLCCAMLVIPAVADMKKLDETELARTNASVTRVASDDRFAGAKKGLLSQEKAQDIGTVDRGDTVYSTSAKVLEGIGLNLNISGQETFKYNFGAYNSNMTGGITWVKYNERQRP